jgi:hypothetical protein
MASGAKASESIPYILEIKNAWNVTCFTHHTFLRHAAHSVALTLMLCYTACSHTYPPCREGLFCTSKEERKLYFSSDR